MYVSLLFQGRKGIEVQPGSRKDRCQLRISYPSFRPPSNEPNIYPNTYPILQIIKKYNVKGRGLLRLEGLEGAR